MAKILLIDDDSNIRKVLSGALQAEGHSVNAADDGDAGLRMAAQERPDVVILDLMMRRTHGFAVIEALRREAALAGVRIIVCSVKSYASDARAALELGADRYLTKPIDPADVVRTVADLTVRRTAHPSKFRVRFWGTRGSIATPGPRTVRYGGNTSCTEVRYGEHILIFDAGTGIRELGDCLISEFRSQPIRVHLFIGHTHWDHIQGFPFFVPAYIAGNDISLYSVRGAGKPLEKIFGGQMDSDYFPVVLSDMKARLSFFELNGPVEIGPVQIRYEYLNHPGIAIGFRISGGGTSLVYLSDHEPFWRLYGHEAGAREDRRIVDFVRGTDLFICEAQYSEEEYARKKGWGHGTFDDALRVAAEAQVGRLVLFHHDPSHDDDYMDRVHERCRRKITEAGYGFDCFVAREAQVFEI